MKDMEWDFGPISLFLKVFQKLSLQLGATKAYPSNMIFIPIKVMIGITLCPQ